MAEHGKMIALQRAPSAAVGVARPDLTLQVEHAIGVGKLQIFGAAAEQRFGAIMDRPAPATGTQHEVDGLTVAWLAPGEWLLMGAEPIVAEHLARIAGQDAHDVLVNDLTHARTCFNLRGANARGALAGHCPLDLWPTVFPVNAVARSLIGDAGVFIARLPDAPEGACFRIVVDQTAGAYTARMLVGPSRTQGARQ